MQVTAHITVIRLTVGYTFYKTITFLATDCVPDWSTARHAPATARNREPILAVLARVLPESGTVLEIASGTGEHVVFFGGALPHLRWQPSDVSEQGLASIRAHVSDAALPNVDAPIRLDVRDEWPRVNAALCINMIHISPMSATEGLFRGAGALASGSVLVTYGPYQIDGEHTAPSNAAFDASLRARNPEWGVRDLADLMTLADGTGLELKERIAMPANNFTLVWRRR